MAEQTTTITTPVVTPEAFLAERQKFWSSFTSFTTRVVVFLAVLLILMKLFLL